MNDQLLTLAEAAELLKVHPETLRRWDRDGSLVAIKVNERGDRRYNKEDIVQLIKYRLPVDFKGHKIIWDSMGFASMTGNFGSIAKIIVQKNNINTGFAFASSGLQQLTRSNKEKSLDELALKQIENFIENKLLLDEDVHTYEFRSRDFVEVQNPEWWNGPYTRALVNGLIIVAGPTHPNTIEQKSWRVILKFKSEQQDYWVTNTFGKNNEYHEYFVEVDSKELIAKNLTNTPKNAEIIAMAYLINRFEETKDNDGNREITRIEENRAACFGGKCLKGQYLPEEEHLSHS